MKKRPVLGILSKPPVNKLTAKTCGENGNKLHQT